MWNLRNIASHNCISDKLLCPQLGFLWLVDDDWTSSANLFQYGGRWRLLVLGRTGLQTICRSRSHCWDFIHLDHGCHWIWQVHLWILPISWFHPQHWLPFVRAWFKFTFKLLCIDGTSLSRDSTAQRSQLEKLLVSYLFAGSLLSASKCCHSLDGENTVLVRFGHLLCHIWFENQVLLLLFRGSVDHLQLWIHGADHQRSDLCHVHTLH